MYLLCYFAIFLIGINYFIIVVKVVLVAVVEVAVVVIFYKQP